MGGDDLDWSDQGPRSRRFDDVYYSLEDGLAESRAVFLQGCGLPDAWAGRRHFVVAELGFGTGLNIAALLHLWARARPPGGRLSIFTIEAHPLAREDAARALAAWPEIATQADALLQRWPPQAAGFHRLDLPELGATVDLAVGDAAWALDQWTGQADAWFLDGFAPARNPEMWSDAVLNALTARSAPGARAATFTVAGAVRRGLAERGWTVEKQPGHGRKRERLEARRPGQRTEAPPVRVAIVGAGVAGAAVARALMALGLTPTVVERATPGAAASGFPGALVTPRLDAGDLAIAALGAQSLARANSLYAETPDAITAHGVLRLEHAPRDADRFARIAAQAVWPAGRLERLDAEETRTRLNEPELTTGGLDMRSALAITPTAVLAAWLDGGARIAADVAALSPLSPLSPEGGWRLLDPAGETILEADAVVLAGGWEGADLLAQAGGPTLAPVRGQANWSRSVDGPAVAWGGYAAPLSGGGLLWGATHDRDDTDCGVRTHETARNRDSLAARLPRLAARLPEAVEGRAAVRAVTPDRLPVCGPVAEAPGLWVIGAMGSRGFTLAPLLGEHLAASLAGAPSPLPIEVARRIDPARPALNRHGRKRPHNEGGLA